MNVLKYISVFCNLCLPVHLLACVNMTFTITSGSFPDEVYWEVTPANDNANVLTFGFAPDNVTVCLPDGCYHFNMYDAFGDGWDGANYTITSASSGVISTGTLVSGFTQTISFGTSPTACIPTCSTGETAYHLVVTNGSFPDEVGWNLTVNGIAIGNGSAGTDEWFCMPSGCAQFLLIDALGDGWNGATYTLSNAAGTTLFTGTLATGLTSTQYWALDGGTCNIPPPISASDCNIAVNVCDNLSFSVDPNGFGTVNEIPTLGTTGNPDLTVDGTNSAWGTDHYGCLRNGEFNSTWMLVNIWGGGSLEFTFGGLGTQVGYYDWIMYPYNGVSTCAAISSNSLSPVRCNWNNANFGGTGLASSVPSGADPWNFEPPLNVTAGQQYLICFSNWSSLQTTVPLDFGGTAIVSCQTVVLPVTLTSFDAFAVSAGVSVHWQTASEENSDYFIIEKSRDEEQWEEVERIPAAGISHTPNDYSVYDPKPYQGWNLYRLRQVDKDGNQFRSDIKEVFYSSSAGSDMVYPNPSSGKFFVFAPRTDFCIYTADGRELRDFPFSSSLYSTQVDLSFLSEGVYYLHHLKTGEVQKLFLLKQ